MAKKTEIAARALALYDGWQLAHPGTPLVAADYRRLIGINLGFVTLAPASELRATLDRVIADAPTRWPMTAWRAGPARKASAGQHR